MSRLLTSGVVLAHLRDAEPAKLRRVLARLDDVQVAKACDTLSVDEVQVVLDALEPDRRTFVVSHMRYEMSAALLERMPAAEAVGLLEEVDANDTADILGRLEDESRAAIMRLLDEEDHEEVAELLAYGEFTAGGIMDPDVVRVSVYDTVGDALRTLQSFDEPPEQAFYVYVVDEDERLIGLCSLHVLVTSQPIKLIREIMRTDVVSVTADTDQEDVAEIVSRYDLIAIPVVDHNNRLLGAVQVDDVVDVLREEATEDILRMAGAGEEMADARSYTGALRSRWRWLAAAAVGGSLTATWLRSYASSLEALPALALFMPVIAGMGGNVGTQSSTVVVRGLAVGMVGAERLRATVLREVAIGATLGLAFGVVVGGLAPWLIQGEFSADLALRFGAVVGLGMLASTTIAAFMGSAVPLVLERIGVDPAVATGPFVTTSVDVFGIVTYFTLASALLELG